MEFENFSSVRQDPAQHARGDEGVDVGIHVLDCAICQHDWGGV